MLQFNCPECHTKIEVDEKFAGKTGKCTECGAPVTVPMPEEQQSTGLDALLGKPGAGVYGAYNKAPDATWDDPAAQAAAEAEARRKAEEEAIPLPEIPAEILAAAKARKNKTLQYVIAAVVLVLVGIVLALPLLMPKPKPAAEPVKPVPGFGSQEAGQTP